MVRLQILPGVLPERAFDVTTACVNIGRAPDNNICLDHSSVSKHHAMLTLDSGEYKLWDLHSTNGSHLNGQRVVIAHPRHGDKIRLGDVELRFEIVDAKPAEPQPHTEERTQKIKLPFLTPSNTRTTGPNSDKTEIRSGQQVEAGPWPHEHEVVPTKPQWPSPEPRGAKATQASDAQPSVSAPRLSPHLSRKRLTFLVLLVGGVGLLFVGYPVQTHALKFVGLAAAATGLLSLVFDLKYGRVIAPPKQSK